MSYRMVQFIKSLEGQSVLPGGSVLSLLKGGMSYRMVQFIKSLEGQSVLPGGSVLSLLKGRVSYRMVQFKAVFRIRIRTDPHKELPPGSGSA